MFYRGMASKSDPFNFAARWSSAGSGNLGSGGFDEMVRQKMGTGVAQGNGGYATGQSPEELFKKAQVGLLGSQTAENKAQTDRLNWLNNLMTNNSEGALRILTGQGQAGDFQGLGLIQRPGAGDNRFIQFPGAGGMTPQPQAAPQGPSSYDLMMEQSKRWGTTTWGN
jgi:hypothetical protein